MSETGPRPTYGDVTAEYRALVEGCAAIEGSRHLVWVRGSDAVAFLDGQVSQDIAGMEPGAVARSFLLEPRGKIVALMWVLRGESEVGLVIDAGRSAAVVDALDRFRFRVNATLEAPLPLVELWGPETDAALDRLGYGSVVGWSRVDDGTVARLPARWPVAALSAIDSAMLDAAGVVRAGLIAATTVRIEAGEPVSGVDIDETTIPQETGLVDEAVSFTKGCFLGQELVARIDSRGRVNRHLRGIVMTENLIPPVGATVEHEGVDVGRLTSVGESLRVGAPIAMALVRREVDPEAPVRVSWDGGSAGAVVRSLPLA
ncbi:MAG TPA: glycine cleavage T C-terminal barrel domain-containing protein [Acidimicrobiia bacterium]|nr:glycine cleavage T C-terminal barrel domain-containing protein [Acidimicrobiia bacterium]